MSDDNQVFFYEEQSFRQRWVWACVALPMLVIALIILWQVWLGRPGSAPPQLTRALVWTELVLLACMFWLYKLRLVTEVRAAGLVLHFQWLWRRRWIPSTRAGCGA